jgi:hypothetical protein
MPVFGSLRRNRSGKESEGNEGPENRPGSEGSVFKQLLRRTSGVSVKDEKSVVSVLISRKLLCIVPDLREGRRFV